MHLSIIIPCYNEERNIRLGALEKVAHYLEKQSYTWECTIVDDGSRDDSIDLIESFCLDHKRFSLLRRRHQGKAAAVTAGVLAATGALILFTDLDQATPVEEIEKLLPRIDRGIDIVIGSRKGVRRGAPLIRRAMARGFMILRNVILDLGIADTQCGFKLFTRLAAQDVFPRLQVFHTTESSRSGSTVTAGFDVELLFIAKQRGYEIAEVPVQWHYQETRHVNPLKDSWESLRDLLRIFWNNYQGLYAMEKSDKHRS